MTANKEKKKRNNYLSNGENIAVNKRARFDYQISDVYEAGLLLQGSEVKSLRLGRASINESYATVQNNDIVLINANIAEYTQAPKYAQHSPTRIRKLLLNQREINKMIGAIQREGMTLVPIRLYFNNRGLAKLELGLGKGKKEHDKRDTIKDRDWTREQQRIMKEKG